MNIMYTCDNNYVWFMGISMISLFENNKSAKTIKIYLLGKDISKDNKMCLEDICVKYGRNISFVDINTLPIPQSIENNGRWPIICYARLFAPNILLDLNRVLYLDCDTIILDDLSELFSDEYSDKPIYGAKDFIGNYYKQLIGMPKSAVNVNGGVLLFNMEKLREMDSTKMIDSFVDQYYKYISYADQDILNGTFWKSIGYLDASYDIMSIMKVFSYKEIKQLKHPTSCYTKDEVNKALENPKIIHFTGNYRVIRPWFEGSNHPYKNEFLKYKEMSPWKEKELMVKSTQKGEVAIANKIRMLPSWLSCNLLGFLYCIIRPISIRIKAYRREK